MKYFWRIKIDGKWIIEDATPKNTYWDENGSFGIILRPEYQDSQLFLNHDWKIGDETGLPFLDRNGGKIKCPPSVENDTLLAKRQVYNQHQVSINKKEW